MNLNMLHLPSEIVVEILKLVEPSIAPLLRINSQWFGCGIPFTWRIVTSPILVRVPKQRRQIYTSVIRRFRITRETNERLEELGNLSWPSLEMLDIYFSDSDELADMKYLQCYLGQGLRHLHLGGNFDLELLSLSRASCPQLHSFSVINPRPDFTPEILLAFLQDNPSLSDIYVCSGELPLVTAQTLNYLARRNNLQCLSLPDKLDKGTLEAIDEPSPFQHLRTLTSVSATEATLPPLVNMARCVRKLQLSLENPDAFDHSQYIDSVVLRHISNLVELQNLDLLIWGKMSIRNEDIISLKSLTQLKRLSIEGWRLPCLAALNFNDDDFEELFSNLPQLEVLKFSVFQSELTTDSLVTLGRCCPSLQLCEIPEVFDMAAFRYENTPLFLSLESLSIGAFTNGERLFSWSRPYDHVRQLEKHFPKLKELICMMDTTLVHDDITEGVMKLWGNRQANGKAKAARESKRPRV